MDLRLIYRFKVLFLLGLSKSLYVFWYKITKRSSLRATEIADFPNISYSKILKLSTNPRKIKLFCLSLVEEADNICSGNLKYFNNKVRWVGAPPDWFLNPFSEKRFPTPPQPWRLISDFDANVGDIKCVWEASRFDWALTLARAFVQTEEEIYLTTLNSLVEDWVCKNPSNMGVNWKCGQEASFRCFNLILSWIVVGRPALEKSFVSFLKIHALRIESNIRYALSQDNNHATSETSCLYLIGLILKKLESSNDVKRWYVKGRENLERLVLRLIQNDGSFSQNSVNYHRVLLDTLNTVEAIRILEDDARFSDEFYARCSLALKWLYQFVDDATGKVPNLGANDGALICKLHSCAYDDFRPTVQLSSVLFLGGKVFEDGKWDEPLSWYGIKSEYQPIPKSSKSFSDGGYGIIRQGEATIFFRAPYYKFRPSQADAMHVDFWLEKKNLLIDTGTFSYNDPTGIGDILKSAKGHNTIVFDDSDTMPKLGPFLYGEWLRGKFEFKERSIISSFKDYRGYFHEREIQKIDRGFRILDRVNGKFKKADLYWHLSDQDWTVNQNRISFGEFSLEVVTSGRVEILPSPRSKYYQDFQIGKCIKVSLGKEEKVIETVFTF